MIGNNEKNQLLHIFKQFLISFPIMTINLKVVATEIGNKENKELKEFFFNCLIAKNYNSSFQEIYIVYLSSGGSICRNKE